MNLCNCCHMSLSRLWISQRKFPGIQVPSCKQHRFKRKCVFCLPEVCQLRGFVAVTKLFRQIDLCIWSYQSQGSWLEEKYCHVFSDKTHEDLKIPLIQDIIKSNIYTYKDRTTAHVNRLIKDLFTQTLEETRLKRIWPEDLLDDV
jgi:hypothetical protein